MNETTIPEFEFNKLSFSKTPQAEQAPHLGIIALSTDLTIENEMRYFLNGGNYSLLTSRIFCNDTVNTNNLSQMKNQFSNCISLFPPKHKFNAIGYGCTSGALTIGDKEIEKIIKSHILVDHVTSPLTAAKRALIKVCATEIGYIAPYNSGISQAMCKELENEGFKVVIAATFGESLDSVVGCISPESILNALRNIGRRTYKNKLDAIFVSCTSLRCASIIDSAEKEIGIPIISSNSALAWDLANLSQLNTSPSGKGVLFHGQKSEKNILSL